MAVSSLSGRKNGPGLKLDILVNELRGISSRWIQFGVQMQIAYSKLMEIDASNQSVEHCMDCFIEMLEFWLRNDTKASMAKIVSALENIEEVVLAQQLRTKYDIGTRNAEGKCDQLAVSQHLLNPTKRNQQKVKWECAVDGLDKEAKHQYQRFVLQLVRLLDKQHISMDKLLLAWSCTDGNITTDMRNANTLEVFMTAVSGSRSWYDYSTLASIADALCEGEGRRLVASYEMALTGITRKLTNLRMCKKVARAGMKVRVKHDWIPKDDNDVLSYRNTLAHLLKCKPEQFVFKSARRGCIEITFVFSAYLYPELKRVVRQNESLLQKLKVTRLWVEMDGNIVWNRDCVAGNEEDVKLSGFQTNIQSQASSWFKVSSTRHHSQQAVQRSALQYGDSDPGRQRMGLIKTACMLLLLVIAVLVLLICMYAVIADTANYPWYKLLYCGIVCVCVLLLLRWRAVLRRKLYSLASWLHHFFSVRLTHIRRPEIV